VLLVCRARAVVPLHCAGMGCGVYRVVGKTDMNAQSSRSHCGFMIYIRAEKTVVQFCQDPSLASLSQPWL